MAHLTVQEVIDKIRKNYPLSKDQRAQIMRMECQPHRPEFYIPRLARCIASLRFGGLTGGLTKES
jgi:hypothetical protein